jgi:hypothetical protein
MNKLEILDFRGINMIILIELSFNLPKRDVILNEKNRDLKMRMLQ